MTYTKTATPTSVYAGGTVQNWTPMVAVTTADTSDLTFGPIINNINGDIRSIRAEFVDLTIGSTTGMSVAVELFGGNVASTTAMVQLTDTGNANIKTADLTTASTMGFIDTENEGPLRQFPMYLAFRFNTVSSATVAGKLNVRIIRDNSALRSAN